jgi:ribonuclease PH
VSRADGRAPGQMRPVSIDTGVSRYAEGSALVSLGETRVLCTASIEDKTPPFRKGSGTGWLTAEYGMLPRATHTRNAREAARGKQDGRTVEIQRLIGRALRSVVDLTAFGERTITVDCDVLQADGGTRCAAITGAGVAVALAFARVWKDHFLRHWPLRESIAAVSAGHFGGATLLDLCYSEDSQADADFNVVGTATGKLVEVQGTAERTPFTPEELTRLVETAQAGLAQLFRVQSEAVAAAVDPLGLKPEEFVRLPAWPTTPPA